MKKTYSHLIITIGILGTLLFITLNTFLGTYSGKVSENGNLKVEGTKINNKYGREIQLKGVSSHGIQWDKSEVVNYDNLKILKEEWKINVFRIAMYTAQDGYIKNKQEMKERTIEIIDMCIELDLYVIVDWHILTDNDPNIYKKEAIEFFAEISSIYKDVPNLIYEICNEPNGIAVDWINDIVPYATDVIKTIRNNSPQSIIIVGTPDWSKDLISVSYDPLPFENILYAFHFYAGTHGEIYRTNVDAALERGLPIIVSEWGTSTALDSEGFFEEESREWINFLNDRNISWINWSLSNLGEPTSILQKDKVRLLDENLTQPGAFVKSLFEFTK